MSHALHSVVGTIRVEPRGSAAHVQPACEDSTLTRLLESLACCDELAASASDGEESITLLIASRRCRIPSAAAGRVTVRANLTQLLSDLTVEYQQLARAVR